jgi:hypothetical protein
MFIIGNACIFISHPPFLGVLFTTAATLAIMVNMLAILKAGGMSIPDMFDKTADDSYQSGGENNVDTALVVNPSSCSGTTGKNWDILYAQIKNILGESPKVVFTKKSGDGTILTRGFLKNGFKYIVAIGGDGLINEVANGFFTCTVKKERRRGKDITVSNHYDATKVHEEEIQHILEPVNPEAFMAVVPCGTRILTIFTAILLP